MKKTTVICGVCNFNGADPSTGIHALIGACIAALKREVADVKNRLARVFTVAGEHDCVTKRYTVEGKPLGKCLLCELLSEEGIKKEEVKKGRLKAIEEAIADARVEVAHKAALALQVKTAEQTLKIKIDNLVRLKQELLEEK